MRRTKIKVLLTSEEVDQEVLVQGWVKTQRGNNHIAFLAVNDGSTIHNIQVVCDKEKMADELLDKARTGSCVSVKGLLRESQGKGQRVEIEALDLEVLGEADPEKYPLQPKRHSLEFLREIAHLRPRTNTFSAVYRIRHAVIFAIHKFFNDHGFLNIHTPIITGADAEGAGEMFRVTVLDPKDPPLDDEGEVDFKEDFFGKSTNLTVSGQLAVENACLALSDVYTFGPTFRAENSNTSRHLAEFWMVEPEMAFCDLDGNMDLAEEFLKSVISYVMEHNADDLEFLRQREINEEKSLPMDKRHEMDLMERLRFVAENDFVRLTYTEAIQILRNSKPNKKKKFQYLIDEWGADLQSEHERYLVEKHFKKPVILTDYPKEIKAFYMRLNEDDKTVRAMDILFPGIGEIVGGSQREERYDVLIAKIRAMGIDEEELSWYLDTRRFGSAPHSGFGLGMERLIMFVTGMGNIRDVIPFPRTPGSAEF